MAGKKVSVDVLCVGAAAFDLTFALDEHPAADEKLFARSLVMSGGGPAANAAVAACRLGYSAAFAGYLGRDVFGDLHLAELEAEGVVTDFVVRGERPTPLSVVLAKPGGHRSLVNYKGDTRPLPSDALDFSHCRPEVILFDGHEPHLSLPLARRARRQALPTILDAGSLHEGTAGLASLVEYLVCAERFAWQFTGESSEEPALKRLAQVAPKAVITLGERGLVWRSERESGTVPAFAVKAVDSNGAGDALHGALAVCLAHGRDWVESLRFASAVAALTCTRLGARPGLPTASEVAHFLKRAPSSTFRCP